jgi:hypothetical protein
MLSKNPDERYQSPRDLLRELRSLQIEGLDLQWPAELDELSSVETAALGSASWQATQRLQSVMSDQARARNDRRWLWFAGGAAVIALLLGAGGAWKMRAPFMLEVPASEIPYVKQMPTPEAQLALAQNLNNEEGWQSVIDYYPDDETSVTAAKRELALLYLLRSDHAKERAQARELFKHFVDDSPKIEARDRAFGMAGLVVVDFLEKNPQESMRQFADLEALPQSRQLLPNNLARMVDEVVRKNAETVDKEKSDQWKLLLEKFAPTEEPSN